MKTTSLRPIRGFSSFLLSAFLLTVCASLTAEEALAEGTASEADKAWAETEQAFQPPEPPAEWQERRPTPDEIQKFREQQGKMAAVAAKRARAFYEKYPDDEHAATAREREFDMLQIAAQLGNTNVVSRLEELEQAKLDDPNVSEEERYALRFSAMRRSAIAEGGGDEEAVLAAFERGARKLMQEFPSRDEPYELLLSIARNAEADKAKAIAQEILQAEASEAVKESAQALLNRYEALGKPLDLKFTAVDGREVDLKTLTGKVVLVDFWATWCGPCVVELPKVKAVYDRLHSEGFEIVGISFDKDREKLESFLKAEDVPWPQYFDGKGWENEFGRRYAITSIPTMWLVDKQGVLVEVNARNALQDKVERLLAQ